MLRIQYDNQTGDGQLVYENGALVKEGFDLETAVLLSLLCDAPALAGDALPPDKPKRGWVGQAFTGSARAFGSRLWLLEDALATAQSAQLAKGYAEEALQWFVEDGHVRAIDVQVDLRDDPEAAAIFVQAVFMLKDGRQTLLGPFKVN